jgi:hypothetical protein
MKKLFAIVGILCLVSLAMFGTVRGQTLTAGVRMGDAFIYHVTSHWTSTDPYASIPVDIAKINQTDFIDVRLSDVNATNIDVFAATIYKDGMADAARGSINYQTGESSGAFVAIIAANLTANQRVHPSGTDTVTINSTTTSIYQGEIRETNRIYISTRSDEAGVTSSFDRYFDKITGILVSSIETTTYDDPSSTSTVTWTLASSTVWTIPELPVILALPIFMAVTAFATIAYKKTRLT